MCSSFFCSVDLLYNELTKRKGIVMYKSDIISYFMWPMALFNSIGMALFVSGMVIIIVGFKLGLIWLNFVYFLFIFFNVVLFAAFISFLIGLIVGLILGFVTVNLPPRVIYNEKLYCLVMLISSIISVIIISIIFWGKISEHLGQTDHLSTVEGTVLSIVMAIILGIPSQYLASGYLVILRPEKPKNT